MVKRLEVMTLSGREFKVEDFALIKETISLYPQLSRKELSKTICELLGWYQADGEPKYLSCLQVLEKLEAWGEIKLPPLRQSRRGYHRKVAITGETQAAKPLCGRVDEYSPVIIEPVEGSRQGHLWNEYIERYHYLGHRQAFGNQQKYFIRFASGDLLGCMLFSASAWSVACRDEWIGWGKEHRARNLHLVLSNSRFLLFPWIKIKNLASKVLSLSARQVVRDWSLRYGFRPVLLESFVDTDRFAGTCYRAANWRYLGKTAGRGRMDRYSRYLSSVKDVYVFPLEDDFRQLLGVGVGVDVGVGVGGEINR
jgi:hypothetical protein